MRLPSGLHATLFTLLVCPLRESTSCPFALSHTFTVLSNLSEAMRLPSGLHNTLLTVITLLMCPRKVAWLVLYRVHRCRCSQPRRFHWHSFSRWSATAVLLSRQALCASDSFPAYTSPSARSR